MANLPDIDTGEVSFIAYWNAIEQGGVSDIAPNEVTSSGNIVSYTAYDNGVEGRYDLQNGRNATFRVKEDGWFVVYLDRTAKFNQNRTDKSKVHGPWDYVSYWYGDGTGDTPPATSITDSTFHMAIQNLQNNLSNSGSIAYNDTDVGVFNYMVSAASTINLLQNRGWDSNKTWEPDFTYSSSVNRQAHWSMNFAQGETSNERTDIDFEGFNLVDSAGARKWGVVDIINNGLAPSASTKYGHTISTNGYGRHSANVLLMYS